MIMTAIHFIQILAHESHDCKPIRNTSFKITRMNAIIIINTLPTQKFNLPSECPPPSLGQSMNNYQYHHPLNTEKN